MEFFFFSLLFSNYIQKYKNIKIIKKNSSVSWIHDVSITTSTIRYCPLAIIRIIKRYIFGIDCRSRFHCRSIAEKALTKSRAVASTGWIREIGQKVGKWIVAKVAQLTFPLHFSRLILDSLETSYSRPSVCYISLHWLVPIFMGL